MFCVQTTDWTVATSDNLNAAVNNTIVAFAAFANLGEGSVLLERFDGGYSYAKGA
jgi:hypothetical protein